MLTAALAVNLCKSGTLIHLASVLDGFRPLSPFFKGRARPRYGCAVKVIGAPGGNRTHNLLLKRQLLYQLSYRHKSQGFKGKKPSVV